MGHGKFISKHIRQLTRTAGENSSQRRKRVVEVATHGNRGTKSGVLTFPARNLIEALFPSERTIN